MKKAMMGVLLLVAACGVRAQEEHAASRTNGAAGWSATPAAQMNLLNGNANATNSAPASAAPAAASSAAPEPAGNPRYLFGERDDYRWQLGVGFDYFRFNSSQFDANLFGVNATLAYYTNSWFGLEGNVITGFSTGTFGAAHEKILGYLGGIRIGSRRAKWEPWAHGLAGGTHLQPQTAAGGRNGIMAMAGGGADYRVHARLSLRLEADWVYSNYFSQNQNNLQAIAGVVLHF